MLRALARVRDRRAEDAAPVPRGDPRRPSSGPNAETCRDLIEDKKWLKTLAFAAAEPAEADEDEPGEKVEQSYTVEVSGKRFDVRVIGPPFAGGGAAVNGCGAGAARRRKAPPRRERAGGSAAAAAAATRSSRRSRARC